LDLTLELRCCHREEARKRGSRRTVDVALIIDDASPVLTVLDKLEKGKIGHRAAMQWLNVASYDALVEIMHVNGRLMPGNQPMRVDPETRALVRRVFRPAAQPK
jgi:hypothetical protein